MIGSKKKVDMKKNLKIYIFYEIVNVREKQSQNSELILPFPNQ